MTVSQAEKLLLKVNDYDDFLSLFFFEVDICEYEPKFKIVYESYGKMTENESAALYDATGNCFNKYMKLEDGYVKHPF